MHAKGAWDVVWQLEREWQYILTFLDVLSERVCSCASLEEDDLILRVSKDPRVLIRARLVQALILRILV